MLKKTICFYVFTFCIIIEPFSLTAENSVSSYEGDYMCHIFKRLTPNRKSIDMQKMLKYINTIPRNISVSKQKELIKYFGKLLLTVENVEFRNMPLTGINPKYTLRQDIINLFSRLENKDALKYLSEFYLKNNGNKKYDIKDAIIKLGGKIPELSKIKPEAVQKNEKIATSPQPLTRDEKEQIRKAKKLLYSKKIFKRHKLAETMKLFSKYKITSENKRIIKILQSEKVGIADTEYCWQYMDDIGGVEIVEYAKATLLKPVPSESDLKAFDEHDAIIRTAAMRILRKYSANSEKDLEFFKKLLKQKDYQCVLDSCQVAINNLEDKLAKQK